MEHAGFDGIDGAADDVGRLLIGIFEQERQLDHAAVGRRQLGQRGLETSLQFGFVDVGAGIGAGLELAVLVEGRGQSRTLPREAFQRFLVRDAEHPGGHPGAATEGGATGPHRVHRVVDDFLGQLALVQHPGQEVHQPPVVMPVERVEGRAIAVDDATEQRHVALLVGGGGGRCALRPR